MTDSTNHSTNQWQDGLQDVKNAFPNNNITLKNAGDGSMLTNIIMGLIWIIVGLGLFIYTGKIVSEIIEDKKLVDNYVIVHDARVDGECSGNRKLPFVVGCDVEISTSDGQYVEREFIFFSLSKSDYAVDVIAQKDDPSNLNVDLAIKNMSARYITTAIFAIFGLIALFVGYLTLTAIPKKNRLKKIMNDATNQPWDVVAVPIKIHSDSSMEFETDLDGKLTSISIDIEKNKPFIVGDTDQEDTSMALAIKAKNTPTFVPLTKKLKSLKLTKDEKRQITTAIENNFS